jgi:hypothetical protein
MEVVSICISQNTCICPSTTVQRREGATRRRNTDDMCQDKTAPQAPLNFFTSDRELNQPATIKPLSGPRRKNLEFFSVEDPVAIGSVPGRHFELRPCP